MESFKSAAFDFTVHGATPDIAKASAILISSCKPPGASAFHAEKTKVSDFLKREQEVALIQKTNKGIIWKRHFQFRPVGMHVHGTLGALKQIKLWSGFL